MGFIKYVVFFAADVVLIGCLVQIIYIFLKKPTERAVDLNDSLNESKITTFLSYVPFIIAWICLGIFIYCGINFLFSWMPKSWGSYDEDGEFTATRDFLSGLFSFFGSLYLLDTFAKVGHKVHDLDIENDRLRDSFNHIAKQIDKIASSVRWVSREKSTTVKLRDELDKLEKESLELQEFHSWRVRDEFKDKPREEIFRRRLRYYIDIKPTLRLIETIRNVIALPKQEPIPTSTVSEDDCAVCAYVPEATRVEMRRLLTKIPLRKAICDKCLGAFWTNTTG
jgi:hypothetical protein